MCRYMFVGLFLVSFSFSVPASSGVDTGPKLEFDHNHTFAEVVTYLERVT